VNGQSVTVRQPLPLPKGSSDNAVGRGNGCPESDVSLAALRYTAVEKSQVREEECKDERLVSKLARVSVELTEISATKGLSKEDIQKAVNQKIFEMEICYQKALETKRQYSRQGNFTTGHRFEGPSDKSEPGFEQTQRQKS